MTSANKVHFFNFWDKLDRFAEISNQGPGIISVAYLRSLSVKADLDVMKFVVIFLQVSSQRHLPVLRQVLDGPQQLGETLVVLAAADDGGRPRRQSSPRGSHGHFTSSKYFCPNQNIYNIEIFFAKKSFTHKLDKTLEPR